jgi:hypothetical protein
MIRELRFQNHDFCYTRRHPERDWMEQRCSLVLAQSMPVPAFVAHNQLEIGQDSKDEVDALVADAVTMWREREQLHTQVIGTLGGFYTVEEFAQKWPEGYVHFPHPELVPTTLPAYRVEDLNARLTAAREAA